MILNGQKLRAAREAHGLSRPALAEKVGVDPATIKRIENGTMQPVVGKAARIADALGVSLDSLLSPNGDSA